MKMKLAVVSSRFPYPLDKGDKLRLYHQLKSLSQHFEIYLFAINDEHIPVDQQYEVRKLCKEVFLYKVPFIRRIPGIIKSIFRKYPLQAGYYYSAYIKRDIEKKVSERKIDRLYAQLSRTALLTKDISVPKMLDLQDAFSKNYARIAENRKGVHQFFYKRESRLMQRFEQKILQWFDKVCIISAFDREQIPDTHHQIFILPNGVDTDYYKSRNKQKVFDILFSGNMNYLPNQLAADFLLTQIFPKLENTSLCIAGRHATRFQKYESENIHILSDVPDMREIYDQSDIYVAPLFSGAGIQNKLLEAMSMGLPCISTAVCNLSLNARDGKEMIICNQADTFVEAIRHLILNRTDRNKQAENGYQFVHENYNWHEANERLIHSLFDLSKNL